MKRLLLTASLLVLCFAGRATAQEIDAQVNLNLSALNEQDRLNFENFKHDIEGYLSNYSWTTNFSGERVRCTFQFNIISGNGGDYTAQLFVNSTRSLYKSDQLTTMARFFDGAVTFSYYRDREMQHGNSYRSLESVLDFYVYIILGLDYDSYKLQSGTPLFQQAQTVAIVANSANGAGWQRDVTSIGTFTRFGYIQDALDANNRVFRDLMFEYHYNGLDLESTKPEEARVAIGTVIDSLVALKRESSAVGRSVFLRAFFEAKYPELAEHARMFPDNMPIYFQKLGYLDPVHSNYYQEALTKAQRSPASGGG